METVFWLITVLMLFSISSKLDDLKSQDIKTEKKKRSAVDKGTISKYIGKVVVINIDQDMISDAYLFDPTVGTEGVIKEVGDSWLSFEYETKNEVVTRYFRLIDVVSIDEVND